jgi:hypothetical protein
MRQILGLGNLPSENYNDFIDLLQHPAQDVLTPMRDMHQSKSPYPYRTAHSQSPSRMRPSNSSAHTVISALSSSLPGSPVRAFKPMQSAPHTAPHGLGHSASEKLQFVRPRSATSLRINPASSPRTQGSVHHQQELQLERNFSFSTASVSYAQQHTSVTPTQLTTKDHDTVTWNKLPHDASTAQLIYNSFYSGLQVTLDTIKSC